MSIVYFLRTCSEMCGAFFVCIPSGSALGSLLGRTGFAKQRLRGRGRQNVQIPLPVAVPLVKNAFGALRRVRQTQNYKESFRFKSSHSQGTGGKAFTASPPLNLCWTFVESYGIILSAIAGIVHRLVYQPSKLRRWVRFPLPAPKDLNLERFGSFLFALRLHSHLANRRRKCYNRTIKR